MADLVEYRKSRISDAKMALAVARAAKRPVMLWGPPGIGKSEMVRQFADGLPGNWFVIDLRLALMDPTDIRGIPFYNKELGVMDWAPPIDLPDEEMAEEYDGVVLFLDELNAAPPAVQAAAYQLILNRRIGQYKLPDNVMIIAAGNRETDKGVTFRMPAPLANRFLHLEIEINFEDWQNWAISNKVHADVVGYLTFAKSDLFDFDPKSSSRAFATPRSWNFVGDTLVNGGDTLPDHILTDLIAGTVGEGVAIKFVNHREFAGTLPNPADILSGKAKKLKIGDNKYGVSAQYTLTVNLCYELSDAYETFKKKKELDKWHKMADHFFAFMMENFQTEMVVLGARIALKNYNLPFDTKKLKTFKEFYTRYGQLIIDA